MRSLYFLLAVFLLANQLTAQDTSSTHPESNQEKTFSEFTLHRGTNISHWLSQSDRRGEKRRAFITQLDVEYLAGLGFDHLRIPVDEEQMFDEEGNPEVEAFELLNNALDWCKQAGLRAIVDLHILRSHHFVEDEKPLWTDPAEQEKFINLWRSFSDSLHTYPTEMLAYELLNEPVADDPEDWNQLIAQTVAAIREREPDRVIVVGSNRWQNVNTFNQLVVPENDPNILLSFHFYLPFLLTHYQASWTGTGNYSGPVHYPGEIVTEDEMAELSAEQRAIVDSRIRTYHRDTLVKMMAEPLQVARQLGLPLYCGEWGVIDLAPQADRLRWYQDMVDIFKENNVANANWDYRGGYFSLINAEGKPNQELIDIVAPTP